MFLRRSAVGVVEEVLVVKENPGGNNFFLIGGSEEGGVFGMHVFPHEAVIAGVVGIEALALYCFFN